MADPLSISASVVGLTVPALHAARLLLDDLENIKDAPKAVKRLGDDVQSVELALKALQAVQQREWDILGADVTEQSKQTISGCTEACDLFRSKLQRWTKRSDGRLAWQDRASVGFLKQAQIKAMSEQMQNCHLSINSTVSIAILYSSVRHSHITEGIRQTIATRQTDITNAVTRIDKQLIVLENKMEELSVDDTDQEDDAGTEDQTEARGQLQQERQALDVSHKLLEELLSKAQEEAVAKAATGKSGPTTSVTFGINNSGFQAGTINGAISGLSFGGK